MKLPENYKLYLALLTVAIVWGTTYLAIRVAVHTIPPWFVTGIRQTLAALLLLGILLYQKKLKLLRGHELKNQIVLSILMIILANGMTTIAEKHLSSSLTSVLSATSPLLVFLGSVGLGLEKFRLKSMLGLALGFSGILLIFWNGIEDLLIREYRTGILILFVGIFSWASGTLYTKTQAKKNSQDILLNLFYQFAFAGIVQLIFAFAFTKDYGFENWSAESLAWVIYLGIFGSVVTYYAFLYALKKVNPSQISMLSYGNTMIAVFLGWLILNEQITLRFLIATALIIMGVFIMNFRRSMLSRNKV